MLCWSDYLLEVIRFMNSYTNESEIKIIGVGPGNIDLLTPAAKEAVESCDVLIGGRRNLEMFNYTNKEKIILEKDFSIICTYIRENVGSKAIAVLTTGDPGIFSIADYLRHQLPEVRIWTIPGISSLQYLCSCIGMTWDDMRIISLHGRENSNFFSLVRSRKKAAIFTGGYTTPGYVCKLLLQEGFSNIRVIVGERLSYSDEKITVGTLGEIAQMEFDNLSLMIVEQTGEQTSEQTSELTGEHTCEHTSEQEGKNLYYLHYKYENLCRHETLWQYETPGIPDNMFIRRDVPMTKEEVRAVTISKLRLEKDSIVFDIGAGTGSVSIECGLVCRQGCVYAVEMNEAGVELIRQNIAKFNLDNVTVIQGKAPKILTNLPMPNRIFIGGTSGCMNEILDWIIKNYRRNNKANNSSHETSNQISDEACDEINSKIKTKIRVVVNAISPETAYEALKGFEKRNFENVEIANISVSRGVRAGDKHIMKALNPVYIISAEYEYKEDSKDIEDAEDIESIESNEVNRKGMCVNVCRVMNAKFQ
jgi:precorrin-6Y C5,15-methyltransferase (decarboxylating)